MAANRDVMGPPGTFASAPWLTVFCGFIALAGCSINGYFLVVFRAAHLPKGAGGQGSQLRDVGGEQNAYLLHILACCVPI